MNPAQEKLLDEAILRVLDKRDSSFGVSPEAIKHLLVAEAFHDVPVEVVARRLAYMAHEQIGFVCTIGTGDFHSNVRTWRITPRGMNHLREGGQ